MIYQLDRIKQDVRVCMDRNQIDTALITDSDEETLSLDTIIESKVLEAVERVHRDAPYYKLHHGHNLDGKNAEVYWGEMESGWVLLPDDFMRLVVFEMSDWERPVYAAITPADPLYTKQSSRVKAIRGTAQRPVCAIAVRQEGKVLEFWSCKSEEATVSRAVYMPYPRIDEYGGVDISEQCYDAVVYTIAGLVAMSVEEGEKAQGFLSIAKTNLEN